MYKRVETDDVYTLENGEISHPVATLSCQYGGRLQISIDDHCYVLRLRQQNGRYRTTPYIFKEAFEVLVTLPPLTPP